MVADEWEETPVDPNKPHVCDVCGKSFDKAQTLLSHKGRYHKNSSSPRTGTRIGSAPGASASEGPNAAAGTTRTEMRGVWYGIFTAIAAAFRVDPEWDEKDFESMAAGFMVIAKSFPEFVMRLLPILKPVLFFVEAGKKMARIRKKVQERQEREAVEAAQPVVNQYVDQAQGGPGATFGTPQL